MARLAPLLVAVVTILTTVEALACSCGHKPAPERAFAVAAVVFEGEVVGIEDRYSVFRHAMDRLRRWVGREAETAWDKYEERYGFTVTFDATHVWRGPGTRRVVLLTGRGGGDCGFEFEKGKSYVVYAYCDAAGVCSASICTRTRLSADAAEDLRYLRSRPVVPFEK